MRSLRSLLATLTLAALTGCGARTVLSEPSSGDAAVLPDTQVLVDAGFPQPDVVFPRPDVVFPDTVFVDDFVVGPDVVFPRPDVVFPRPDVVFPQPDVVFPQPDVVFPQPDVVSSGNELCARATDLRPGVPVRGVVDGGGDVPMRCATDITPQPARWYRVRVPAGQTLAATFTAVPRLMRGVALRITTACGGACAASNTTSLDGLNITARWTSTFRSDVDVLISVAPTSPAGPPQDFALVATISSPPANASCASATPVTNGTALSNQDLAFATEVQPPCPGMTGTGSASLFYSATVPAGQTLFVSATPSVSGRPAPVIRVIPACGSPVCFAASTAAGTTSAAAFNNASRVDQAVIIAVGAQDPRFAVPFSLAVSIRPPAPNGACATPTRVMNGTALRGESLGDGRDVPTACATTGRDGRALYYAVRVGAGEQLIVLASRVDTTFPTATVRLFDGCGATTCLAQSTQSGNAGRLSYVNTTGAAQELLFAVNLQDGGASTTARVDLSVAVSRPPYAVSAIPGACDMVGGSVIPGAVGDDVGTESLPLPIAFTYFGAPVAQWSVSTNGYIQLWPMSGRSVGALGQTELPSAMAPAGMVAAFWDDLEVGSGEGDVRWQVVDAPSRHLTVQWTNTRFCCGGMNPDRVTFQIKLFERTNVVEYHYCALNGSARTSGSNASIGMQDPGALRGVSYAIRRPGAVMTGSAVRFTP